jgi:hypothetical protein
MLSAADLVPLMNRKTGIWTSALCLTIFLQAIAGPRIAAAAPPLAIALD